MKKHLGVLCLYAAASAALLSTTQPAFAQATNTFPASGNVGVGTTSPGFPLQIVGPVNNPLWVEGTTTTNDYMWGVASLTAYTSASSISNGYGPLLNFQEGANNGNGVQGLAAIGASRDGADNSGDLLFFTFNAGTETERMRITTGGNVGFGTATPAGSARLEINDNTGNNQLCIRYDQTGNCVFLGQTAASGPVYINNQNNSDMYLATNNTGRMAITAGGNVGIGINNPSQALEVNGEVQIDVWPSGGGTSVCRNGAVLSNCSSSIRYKENVNNLDMGLKDVMRMRPVTFKWKDRDENDFGLIAEEMHDINPLYNTYEKGQIEGVKYPQLTAVLVNAIKEQQQEISELKRAVADLKARATTSAALTVAAAPAR